MNMFPVIVAAAIVVILSIVSVRTKVTFQSPRNKTVFTMAGLAVIVCLGAAGYFAIHSN
jgi:hypothetical protein